MRAYLKRTSEIWTRQLEKCSKDLESKRRGSKLYKQLLAEAKGLQKLLLKLDRGELLVIRLTPAQMVAIEKQPIFIGVERSRHMHSPNGWLLFDKFKLAEYVQVLDTLTLTKHLDCKIAEVIKSKMYRKCCVSRLLWTYDEGGSSHVASVGSIRFSLYNSLSQEPTLYTLRTSIAQLTLGRFATWREADAFAWNYAKEEAERLKAELTTQGF